MKKLTKLLSLALATVMLVGTLATSVLANSEDPKTTYTKPTLSVDKSSVKTGDMVTYSVRLDTSIYGGWYDYSSFNLRTYLPDEVTLVSANFKDDSDTSYPLTIGPGGAGEINCWDYLLDFTHNKEENYVDLNDGGYQIFRVGATIWITIKAKANVAGNPKNWFTKTVFQADGRTLTTSIGVEEIIPEHEHVMTYYEAKQPTCTAAGNIAYYHCSVCNKMFKDEAGTTKIVNPTLNALGHKWSKTSIKKATPSANGSISYTCANCGAKKNDVIYRPASFAVKSVYYNGKAQRPAVTVKNAAGKVIGSGNYTLTYSGNKAVGKGNVRITFKGNYSGAKNVTFYVMPRGTSLTSVKAARGAFTARWRKQANQTTGYEIQCSLKKNFSSGNKIARISKNKTLSQKVSKLPRKKTYYVRVRTFKTVKGQRIYSGWSGIKAVKTK